MDAVASKRGKQTVRDMILSTLVITACAGVIYLFIPKDEHADPIKAVDFTVELATVRTAAPYPVAAPEGLPKEWKATSVRYDDVAGDAWHLGFLDADRRYVAVEQSTTAAGTYVPDFGAASSPLPEASSFSSFAVADGDGVASGDSD
ncbi:DUF4245 domain-containing protein, partial [Streptomyces griseus]|uniref:DUF4245 domain-containing protein n=1 Tax=Streptomyces griseus TaxID=1911 RepID=UPI0033DCC8B3